MFYDKYVALCAQKGITPSAAAKEIGINKAAVSNWKYRKNGPSDVTMKKIADYFDVPVSELLDEKENTPTPEGKRKISNDDIMFALWGDSDDVDENDLDDVKRYAAFIQERKKKNDGSDGPIPYCR